MSLRSKGYLNKEPMSVMVRISILPSAFQNIQVIRQNYDFCKDYFEIKQFTETFWECIHHLTRTSLYGIGYFGLYFSFFTIAKYFVDIKTHFAQVFSRCPFM